MVRVTFSPAEQAYLNGTREFTKAQQRYVKCRIKRKLQRCGITTAVAAFMLKSCNAAAATPQPTTLETNEPTCPFGHEFGKDIIISNVQSSDERGSPSLARARGSLVGRGIANPMSERTRGFEIPWIGYEIPTPRAYFFAFLFSASCFVNGIRLLL